MARGIGIAVVLGLMVTSPGASVAAPQDVARPKAMSKLATAATDIGARRHARHHDGVRRLARYEPHYYARPVYYRPYPYGMPAPFVFGYGPFW